MNIAFIFGFTALVVGFSFIVRWQVWSQYISQLRTLGQPAALIVGYVHLLIGSFIVAFHWQWSELPLLLTLIGVKAITEGVVYTMFPKVMVSALAFFQRLPQKLMFRIFGLITISISLIILQEILPPL